MEIWLCDEGKGGMDGIKIQQNNLIQKDANHFQLPCNKND
jgi:hypothetical protein